MHELVPYFALGIAFLTFVFQGLEKVFGGGNALANKFHALDKDTTEKMTELRNELHLKIDEYEKVSTVGFDATRASIHAMQLGLLEFRAKMSEDLHLYIRKDDYNAGVNDVKRDMQNGFRDVGDRLGQLQDLIMYANPDAPVRQNPNHKRNG